MDSRILTAGSACPARYVPSGVRFEIPKGSFVTLTQSLGGNYSVIYEGNLARVDGTDAEALGLKKPEALVFIAAEDDQINEDQIWQALRTVYDPEISENLVDLGLIYLVKITNQSVLIEMTLTSPTCGMGQVLLDDVQYRVGKVPNVQHVDVQLVFDPPWTQERLSDDVKMRLGLL